MFRLCGTATDREANRESASPNRCVMEPGITQQAAGHHDGDHIAPGDRGNPGATGDAGQPCYLSKNVGSAPMLQLHTLLAVGVTSLAFIIPTPAAEYGGISGIVSDRSGSVFLG